MEKITKNYSLYNDDFRIGSDSIPIDLIIERLVYDLNKLKGEGFIEAGYSSISIDLKRDMTPEELREYEERKQSFINMQKEMRRAQYEKLKKEFEQ